MWDNTNINLSFQPSCADEQRLTYSQYYAGNCAKAGVFMQLCGWMGVESLWVGATSNSHYLKHTKTFEKQQRFAKEDKVDGKEIPFSVMLDKGYHVNLPAFRADKQQVMQPTFAKSDKKFTGQETIYSASIASHRGANERGVNRSKLCGYLRRGLHPNGNPSLLDDVWLSWWFTVNFLYKSVL